MADDLDAFYAEIATVEAQVAEEADAPAAAETKTFEEPLAPPPVPPPSAELPAPDALPPPPRPPSVSAVVSHGPVIAAPPVAAAPPEPEPTVAAVPVGPNVPPPPTAPPPKPAGPALPPGKKVGIVRRAAGEKWVDTQLAEWPEDDFRIFVGNLAPEVTDAILTQAFEGYDTLQKVKVVRDNRTNKSKGYGFVSFADAKEGVRALREMNGQYIGNRPCQLKKGKDERTVTDQKGKARKRVMEVKPPAPPPPPKYMRQGGGGGRGGGRQDYNGREEGGGGRGYHQRY